MGAAEEPVVRGIDFFTNDCCKQTDGVYVYWRRKELSMFRRKKVMQDYKYDPEIQKPILKCSICNGEQVAGFKNLQTGKFEEIMLISCDRDLHEFMQRCKVSTILKEY